MASGDTAYLSPAGQFREVVTVAMTSAVAETKIIGDPANLQGFKTSGAVAVAPGPIIWTAYTTNDKTAPSGTALLTLAGRDYLTFEKIMFVAGYNHNVTGAATSQHITFRDCSFLAYEGGIGILLSNAFNVPFYLSVDRCIFLRPAGVSIQLQAETAAAGSDYDIQVDITNSMFIGGALGQHIYVLQLLSQTTAKPGGAIIRNCHFFGSSNAILAWNSPYLSTSIPIGVYNSHFTANAAALYGEAGAGMIVENYNLISAPTPRINVTPGANSISDNSYAQLYHFGQELQWGMNLRPFLQPFAGSPLLGFGNDGSQTAYDLDNNPRPAGGASASAAVGSRERGNSWGRETSTVRTGSNALSITGPGYQDFLVPVDASATTVTCYLRQDTTYAGTSPKLIALANAEIGVTEQTDTLVVADDTWEQLSVSFTPTAKGIITIRLLSSDTNGGGKAFADDFEVT